MPVVKKKNTYSQNHKRVKRAVIYVLIISLGILFLLLEITFSVSININVFLAMHIFIIKTLDVLKKNLMQEVKLVGFTHAGLR